MRKTHRKNARRTIKENFGRFAAIFAIVALGVGFMVGLLSATPDMYYSFDLQFDNQHMYDVRILGDYGMTDKDIAELKKLDNVEEISAAYTADILLETAKGNSFTARMHSVPKLGESGKAINAPELAEGRMPERPGECLLINSLSDEVTDVKIGDTLTVSKENKKPEDSLESMQYKIVGTANSGLYFSVEKEYTNIGGGTIDMIIFTPPESFVTDVYTDVYLTVPGAEKLNGLSDNYFDLVNETEESVKAVGKARGDERRSEVLVEAGEKIEDAKKEYADAKQKAETELADAKKKLDDGRWELANGQKELADAKQKIADGEAEIKTNEETLNKKEQDANAEFANAERKLADAQKELEANTKTINEKLTAAENQLASLGLSAAQQTAFTELRKVAGAYPSLPNDLQALQTKSERLKAVGARLMEIAGLPLDKQAELADELKSLMAEKDTLQADLAAIMSGEGYTAFTEAATKLAQTGAASPDLQTLAMTLSALDGAKAQISGGQAQIDTNRKAFEAQKADALKQIADGRGKISSARAELAGAKREYNKGMSKLNNSSAELADGEKTYKEESKKAETELADAQDEIADAEKKLNEMDTPKWYVMDREDNASYASIETNIDKVEAISTIFPVFFFLVAALVALTTMTRMVEDERQQIGTMKALGYSRAAITSKYILYALAASLTGSLIGIAVGFQLFPTVIWNVYETTYYLPKLYCQINWMFALITTGVAVGCTLLATLNACNSTLREKPAQLMLPKAPEAGQRILLERVTPIWRRMKFTHKVTARNLIRYKKRFFMTVIGVAGCTALLVTGFGLRDSFRDVVDKQYAALCTYDIIAPMNAEGAIDDADLQAVLSDKDAVSSSTSVFQETHTASFGDKSLEIYTFIPENAKDLEGFVTLRERRGHDEIPFGEGSVIITEKASEILKIDEGETLKLTDEDGNEAEFTISGICENYMGNYIYMSAEAYKAGFAEAPRANTLIVRVTDNSEEARVALGKQLLQTDAVEAVRYTGDAVNTISDMLGKIDLIVLVLIISAGALALVVLYNLTNINISERVKELATIKVLGFTDKEVYSYVNRESLLLSFVGALVGILLGVLLHSFVMGNIEMDAMMFGRSVKPLSYLYSAALTMLFSVLIDLCMRRKLRNISMVESMKAPE
ncbi:MAG: FtsX-like permease family protein [Oscillospiraceae bacterium]